MKRLVILNIFTQLPAIYKPIFSLDFTNLFKFVLQNHLKAILIGVVKQAVKTSAGN